MHSYLQVFLDVSFTIKQQLCKTELAPWLHCWYSLDKILLFQGCKFELCLRNICVKRYNKFCAKCGLEWDFYD